MYYVFLLSENYRGCNEYLSRDFYHTGTHQGLCHIAIESSQPDPDPRERGQTLDLAVIVVFSLDVIHLQNACKWCKEMVRRRAKRPTCVWQSFGCRHTGWRDLIRLYFQNQIRVAGWNDICNRAEWPPRENQRASMCEGLCGKNKKQMEWSNTVPAPSLAWKQHLWSCKDPVINYKFTKFVHHRDHVVGERHSESAAVVDVSSGKMCLSGRAAHRCKRYLKCHRQPQPRAWSQAWSPPYKWHKLN